MTEIRSEIADILRECRSCWKTLTATLVIYNVIAVIVLAPLAGVLFRGLLATAGDAVLTDQDILFFFLGPVGWMSLILVGGIFIGIVAIELAALLVILQTSRQKQTIGVGDALRFATAKAWPILRLASRLVATIILAVAPFLIAAGALFYLLLTDYDINYYLKEKPPVFLLAVGLGAVLVLSLTAVLLRLLSGWLFALPIVVFENIAPVDALKLSRERAKTSRRTLVAWIAGWAAASLTISVIATGAVVGLGRLVVPYTAGSLGMLAMTIGIFLILWTLVSLTVNLLSTATFAAILLNLFRRLGSDGNLDGWAPPRQKTPNGTRGYQLSPTRLIALTLVGLLASLTLGIYAIRSVRLEDQAEVTAHRGSSHAAPENTMAAVRLAIEDKTDWVEIDVQETADGQVVVFHDSDFMKLSGVNLKIWDATMADLADLDIGSWFDPKFKSERVPTLGEVLDICKDRAGVNIELKYYGHDQQLEERVVEIVESHGMAEQVVVMSLKRQAVAKMKALRPQWKVGLLMSVSAGNLENIQADFLAINASFANRKFIRSAHDLKKEVFVWTVNDAPTMSSMIGRGVDGLITDKPALARSVLERRAEMSPGERLMLELAELFGCVPKVVQQ